MRVGSLHAPSNHFSPGITLGISDLKMTEWADEGGAGLNSAHSSHPHADGADDGEKLQRHLDNDQNATSDEGQHDAAEMLCPPPSAVVKAPSPVLRVMVDGEWVPLKVECQWRC